MNIPGGVGPTESAGHGKEIVVSDEGMGGGVYFGRGVGRREIVRAEPTEVVATPVRPSDGRGREREAFNTRVRGGTENFSALRLKLSNIPGRAIVRTGSRAGAMSVQITGSEELAAKVERYVADDTLHIVGPSTGFGGGSGVRVISSGGGTVFSSMTVDGNMSVIGDRVFVNGVEVTAGGGGAAPERVEIVVDVPWQAPIRVEDRVGAQYEIGDTEGALILQLKGGGGVVAGRVADTQVAIQGSSDVEIQAVTGGTLRGSIQGSGDLTVREGRVDNLILNGQGAGDAVYGGVVRRAELSMMGSGDIRVNHVTESLSDRCLGSGDIRVHVRPQGNPDSFWA